MCGQITNFLSPFCYNNYILDMKELLFNAVSRSPKVGLPISEKLGVRHSDSESAKLGVRMSDSQSILKIKSPKVSGVTGVKGQPGPLTNKRPSRRSAEA